jgi:hypothetical protein
MEKSITITAPDGYEVDKEKSSFEKIVFRALPDKGLPRSWKELNNVSGYYVTDTAGLKAYSFATCKTNRNTWPTLEEAEASIALAQLCQLRDRYNGGWKPDWNAEAKKYVIYRSIEGISGASYFTLPHVLAFKTPELRDEFMKNFADLIEKAKPLLG